MAGVFVHERALCESADVGEGTRISAFAHVRPGACVGTECTLSDAVFLNDGCIIGDRVVIEAGVQIGDGVRLENDVFVGANTTFTGDVIPRPQPRDMADRQIVVRQGASIGANATILPGVEIGREAVVGPGSVVSRSVPPHAVVAGNPATLQGYLETGPPPAPTVPTRDEGLIEVPVGGVHVQRFAEFADFRGSLTAGDLPSDAIPFAPRRWFLVYDVPSRELRGEHAHRVCHQFLICVTGSVRVVVDDGEQRSEVVLDRPTIGIYIPPLVWASQFRHERDSVLLVMASHPYDSGDYIREYEQFRAEVTADRDGGRVQTGNAS